MKNKLIQNILLILLAVFLVISLGVAVKFFNYVSDLGVFSRNDDGNAEIKVEFSGSEVYCDYDCVDIQGTRVVITEPGDYFFSGYSGDGQIIIDDTVQDESLKGNYDDYRITFDGIDLTSKKGSPFAIYKADKIKISIDGDNVLTDASTYSDSYASGAANACFYSKRGFELDGAGSLTINGNYNHGLSVRGKLYIKNANLVVNAPGNAIDVKKELEILDGDFVLNAGGDGFNIKNNDEPGKGLLVIKNGSYLINASDEGIRAADQILIDNSKISISALGDGISTTDEIVIDNSEVNIVSSDDGLNGDAGLKIADSRVDISAGGRLYRTKGVVDIGDDCLFMHVVEEDN